jgi:hypothetical protein
MQLINEYKTKTKGWEKSLNLMLLHGKQPRAGLGDKMNTSVWNKGQNQPKEEA